MPITLVCHGHAALGLDIGGARLLVDPFFSDNPSSDTDPADLPADFILVSHGHGDHVGDTVDIAKRTGATVIANFELASWFGAQGVSSVHAQHLGGGYHHPFGYLKLTLALHGSGLSDGSSLVAPRTCIEKAPPVPLNHLFTYLIYSSSSIAGGNGD